jgi:DNA-binding XRE family transcriptional regulator
MNRQKQKALEAAGYRVGNAADFLGLSPEESALVDLRVAVSQAVQLLRKKRGFSQVKLAEMIESSQSRIAKIEAGSNDVSLDLMLRSYFALGGQAANIFNGGFKTGAKRGRGSRKVANRAK